MEVKMTENTVKMPEVTAGSIFDLFVSLFF